MEYAVRRARTSDVPAIRSLIDANVASGRLLDKPTVMLYEDIQEFRVACAADGAVAGCARDSRLSRPGYPHRGGAPLAPGPRRRPPARR